MTKFVEKIRFDEYTLRLVLGVKYKFHFPSVNAVVIYLIRLGLRSVICSDDELFHDLVVVPDAPLA